MDLVQTTFLKILCAALRGQPAAGCEELTAEQWAALYRLAEEQKLLPMVYEATYALPALQSTAAPLAVSAKRRVVQQVMQQALRTEEFLQLEQRLSAAGVRPLVVKGMVCRSLYPKPDHRLSADEDLLCLAEEYAACQAVLEEFGLCAGQEDADGTAYEIPYRKPGSPLYLELHRSLFPPQSAAYGDWNRFFEGALERAVRQTVPGGAVWTLCPDDHLFYLICHAFKHFLHSGFGVRQVCDILRMAETYGGRLDWPQLRQRCAAIRAEKFTAAIFRIGERWLGFVPARAGCPADWQAMAVDELPMLEDLLAGGVYGGASLSRRHSSSITLEAVRADKQGRKAGGVLASAFPPAQALAEAYPYLKRRPYLLPAAWAQRLWRYARETRTEQDSSAVQALQLGRERVALLRQYDILD